MLFTSHHPEISHPIQSTYSTTVLHPSWRVILEEEKHCAALDRHSGRWCKQLHSISLLHKLPLLQKIRATTSCFFWDYFKISKPYIWISFSSQNLKRKSMKTFRLDFVCQAHLEVTLLLESLKEGGWLDPVTWKSIWLWLSIFIFTFFRIILFVLILTFQFSLSLSF